MEKFDLILNDDSKYIDKVEGAIKWFIKNNMKNNHKALTLYYEDNVKRVRLFDFKFNALQSLIMKDGYEQTIDSMSNIVSSRFVSNFCNHESISSFSCNMLNINKIEIVLFENADEI